MHLQTGLQSPLPLVDGTLMHPPPLDLVGIRDNLGHVDVRLGCPLFLYASTMQKYDIGGPLNAFGFVKKSTISRDILQEE